MGEFDRAQDEDCLTLTIATPDADVRGARCGVAAWRRVAQWRGSLDWYDGGPLAKFGDVVVVGVNYRLGPLGFLHYPDLADGMMGLHDMVAALRFIRTHIANFGGDPDCVTLMGSQPVVGPFCV